MKFELPGNRESLHIQVYNQLKEYILSGQLKAGEIIIEQNIAKEMNISKTPVREALRELAQEGLVVHHPRKKITVIDFTEKDIEEITSLRAAIEEFGISICVSKLDASDKESLFSIVEEIYAQEKAQDYSKSTSLDLYFHEYLIKKTNHTRLIKNWEQLQSQTRVLLQMIEYYKMYTGYSGDSHKKLLEGIFSGNTQTAKASMKNHILESGKNILQFFNEKKSGSSVTAS